jgi:hypothetical protein
MKSNDDDPRLTGFLRQHKPLSPAPATHLEDQIVRCLDSHFEQLESVQRSRWSANRVRRSLWAVSSVAAMVAAVVSYRALYPPAPNAAELAELEIFIESTWHGDVSSQPADLSTPDDLFVLPEDAQPN